MGFFQVSYQNIWEILGLKMCLSDVDTEESGQHEDEVSKSPTVIHAAFKLYFGALWPLAGLWVKARENGETNIKKTAVKCNILMKLMKHNIILYIYF